MHVINRLRTWVGNFLTDVLRHLLYGKLEEFTQRQNTKLTQLLRKEFEQADAAGADRLEAQMNFQPDLPTGWQNKVKQGDGYVGFENIFRDSKIIAARNKRYLPYFADSSHVLDIGCGRGEFLELLKKQGIAAAGIDSSPEMIEVCRKKGLKDVKVADVIEYLSSLPESSQGGIFSCHMLEHLPAPNVITFFSLAWKSLRPGGRLILETPNPHSLPAFKLFWLDPTHVRPLFPEFLEWAARAGGFTEVEIKYLTEDGFSPTHGPWYGNYALVATK